MTAQTEIQNLEDTIKQLPGVLGCVILTGGGDRPHEIQAFTQTGTDRDELQERILQEVGRSDLGEGMSQVFVFELEAESYFGDLESLERAVEVAEQEARTRGPAAGSAAPGATEEGGRAAVRRVALASSPASSEATVALGRRGSEVVGQASAAKTPHGLSVLAQATLDAAAQIVPGTAFELKSASLVSVAGQEAVLTLVNEGDNEMLGAALTRGGPLTEATVRSTLDAINRRLALRA